jgi:hypothetical protein
MGIAGYLNKQDWDGVIAEYTAVSIALAGNLSYQNQQIISSRYGIWGK